MTRSAPTRPATPSGTLTRKIERQPRPARSPSVSAPPSTGAATALSPITGPKAANAFVISSSAKTSLIIPKPCGMSSAPNAPWTTRAAIRVPGVGAAAHSADAVVKPTIPTMNTRRRPKRSPSRPPVISSTAKASVYAAPSHCSVVALPPRSARMDGAATLTIVPSMRSMTSAISTIASTAQRRRKRSGSGGAADGVATAVADTGRRLLGRDHERCSRTLYVTNAVRVNRESAYTPAHERLRPRAPRSASPFPGGGARGRAAGAAGQGHRRGDDARGRGRARHGAGVALRVRRQPQGPARPDVRRGRGVDRPRPRAGPGALARAARGARLSDPRGHERPPRHRPRPPRQRPDGPGGGACRGPDAG